MLSSDSGNIQLVERLESIKIAANEAVARKDYEGAIKSYTECIKVCRWRSALSTPDTLFMK